MNTQMTLNALRKCLKGHTRQSLTQVKFLKAVLTPYLYENESPDKNIHLCDSYDSTRNWISHLMNYKSCTKSGANHVRSILLDLIHTKPESISEIAQNCRALITNSDGLTDELLEIIQQDSSLEASIKVFIEPLVGDDCYLALACCIVYSLFPDHKERITHLICTSCSVPVKQPLPSEDDLDACLCFLQQTFNTLFQHIRNNNFAMDTSDSETMQKLENCKRVLAYGLLYTKISGEFYQLLKGFVNQMETLKMWDALNPTENGMEALNSLGKRMVYIAELEIQLDNLNQHFSNKRKHPYGN